MTCLAGAREVQKSILEEQPTAKLKAYTVWVPMLAGDSREGWRSGAMPDPRVTHLWDPQRVVSKWLDQHVEGVPNRLYDYYLIYGPDATWQDANTPPTSLIGLGATVLDKKEALEASLNPLLK